MNGLRNDILYALRMMRKSPGFTLIAAGTLALGIAANTVVFSAVNGFLLKPLPIADPDRVVLLKQTSPPERTPSTVAWPDYQDWKRGTPALSSLGVFSIDTFNITGGQTAERVRGSRADSGLFRTLGITPLQGRLFNEADDAPGAPRVAVLNDAFWQRRFNRAPEIVGGIIRLDGVPHTVIGIAPATARIPMGFNDIFVSINGNDLAKATRGNHFLGVLGRIKPGSTIEECRSQLDALARRLGDEYPDSNKGWGVTATPLQEAISVGPKRALVVLSVAVGLVLLICCANLANLLLARGSTRTREISVRGALGASPVRLWRQLLVESASLACLGMAGGLLLGRWGIDGLVAALPPVMQPPGGIGMDDVVLCFTIGLTLATVIVFGTMPALKLMRASTFTELRTGARSAGAGIGRSRLSSALVAGEMTLAVLLLSSAGVFIASLVRMQSANAGYRPEGVLTAEVAVKSDRYREPQQQADVLNRILLRAATLPGVQAVSAVNFPPMTSSTFRAYAAEGRVPAAGTRTQETTFFQATPEYLRTLGMKLVKGRFFTVQDTSTSEPVAVINQALARASFAGEDPLGRHVALYTAPGKLGPWMRVVGVIGDVRHFNPASDAPQALYVPFQQSPNAQMYLALRTTGKPRDLALPLRDAVNAVDPDLPLNLVRSMEQVMADGMTPARITTGMMSIFAALALALATMGLYGVISFLVVKRTHEFGVRMALGATRGHLLRLVLRRTALLTGIGALLGFAGGIAVTRVFRSFLADVIRPEPLAFVAVAVLLALVGVVASWLPVRRALRLDPVRALRVE